MITVKIVEDIDKKWAEDNLPNKESMVSLWQGESIPMQCGEVTWAAVSNGDAVTQSAIVNPEEFPV